MEEIWKDIEGYEGLYQVSNLGRVRSLDQERTKPHPRNTSMVMHYTQKGKVLKPKSDGVGYWQVCLWKDKKSKTIRVHRLVAEAFIPNPDNLPEVNHIDEDKTNPIVTNLEWVTKSGNMCHGTCGERMGRNHWKAIVQMDMDGNVIKEWPCAQHASKALGISHSQIIGVCKKHKGHDSAGGYRWKYKE